MKETPTYELPKANEKLAHKFIMDSLMEDSEPELEVAPQSTGNPISPALGELAVEAPAEPMETSDGPTQGEPISVPIDPLDLPPGKKYFRIREVTLLTGVEPYVLRYWENEFSTVRPTKSRTGQRVYSRSDVEELHLIRHLLHVEKFSIKGAKKQLLERRQKRPSSDQIARQRQVQALKELSQQLRELIQCIRGNPGLVDI